MIIHIISLYSRFWPDTAPVDRNPDTLGAPARVVMAPRRVIAVTAPASPIIEHMEKRRRAGPGKRNSNAGHPHWTAESNSSTIEFRLHFFVHMLKQIIWKSPPLPTCVVQCTLVYVFSDFELFSGVTNINVTRTVNMWPSVLVKFFDPNVSKFQFVFN